MIPRIEFEMTAVGIRLAGNLRIKIIHSSLYPGFGILEFRETDACAQDAR